jgi:hypothetical protein
MLGEEDLNSAAKEVIPVWPTPDTSSPRLPGTYDGTGAGDHDQPYRFGWRPRVNATYPFSERQYARLLVLRSRYQSGTFDQRQLDAA